MGTPIVAATKYPLRNLSQRRPLLDNEIDKGLLSQFCNAFDTLASDDARDSREAPRAHILDQVGAEDGRRDGE
eukprot:6178672-Pleurochrysis_carterae.AAC.1